ncbi:WD40/YVTN/BNR-like repeat-containing protein [Gemmatimonadota bacterium]
MSRFLFLALAFLALSQPLGRDGLSAQSKEELSGALQWRNIGPANMAGRVTDIEAVEADFSRVIVGSASGGAWKSDDAGTTWTPIFESYGSGNIGDIAVFQPNPDIIWIGTGESCTRNSVGWGDGVYKSMDGGETFENVGLRDTHHISEVITHPTDPDIVYVASQGHLWGHAGEKGLFKTEDGGQSWRRLAGGLPDDGRTGASDLKMDPRDPNTLYSGFWERIRMPHKFLSGGPNGGIFKSTDGGESWEQLRDGLPEGDVGKIGLAISRSNPSVVMAIVEHGFQPLQTEPAYSDLSQLGTGIYRSEDGGATWTYVNRYNNRPFYYSHIWMDPVDDQRVYVLAGSAQVSEDGGRTFDRSFEGISGDFHALWIDPSQPRRFYVGNDKGSYVTFDGGHHFVMFDNMDIGQFYAVTADMRDPYWVYGGLQDNGNWGGPSNSRDWNGILNDHWFKFHSGDGFHTTVDPNDWRTVYTESQGGRISRFDAVFRQQGKSITPTPGTIVNFHDAVPEYLGSRERLSREDFRFNWSSPLRLSPHNSNTLLFGGNYLFRSRDRGESWEIISPDLSTADPILSDPESGGLTRDVTSAETHATIITLAESPLTAGLIWVGTDDGRLHVTRDDGETWDDVGVNLPDPPRGLWVSRVEPSRVREGTAYVSVDGHRSDEFRPWIFKTTDFGQTWTRISSGIPDGHPIYVVREDLKNPELLFAGSEFGAFVSVDGGDSWQGLGQGLPTVAVHDLIVHPRDGDLIAATHGRSIWILDDVTPLQQLDASVRESPLHLFVPKIATLWKGISRGATRGHKLFMGRNPLTIGQQPPGNSPNELVNTAAISFWLGAASSGVVTVEISTLDGGHSIREEVEAHPGLNRWFWDLRWAPSPEEVAAFEERMADAQERFGGQVPSFFQSQEPQGEESGVGTYLVRISAGGAEVEGTLTVREDPGLEGVSPSVR